MQRVKDTKIQLYLRSTGLLGLIFRIELTTLMISFAPPSATLVK